MEVQEEHTYSMVVIRSSTQRRLWVGVNTEDVASLGLVSGMPVLLPAVHRGNT